MKNRFLILLVLAATLLACNSDSVISDDFNKEQIKAPIKIKRVEGTFTITGDASCPFKLNAEGEGIVSRLGLSTLAEEWCTEAGGVLGSRSIIITAANGDELWGFHNSVVWTSANSFVETLTFQGGTGRFKDAEGEFTEYVEISLTSGTFVLNGEGTLKY